MQHQVEVSRVIAATPTALYDLVADLPQMARWSPENTGGAWVKGATRATVGARFKGTNRKGSMKWSTLATVVTAEPGAEFAFAVTASGMKVAHWGFRFEAVEGGTQVTEYWDDQRNAVMAKITGMVLRVPDRSSHNRVGMEQTLERLGASV
ncbi:MAG: SRPBCC family protein [Actinomycetota bacterium]